MAAALKPFTLSPSVPVTSHCHCTVQHSIWALWTGVWLHIKIFGRHLLHCFCGILTSFIEFTLLGSTTCLMSASGWSLTLYCRLVAKVKLASFDKKNRSSYCIAVVYLWINKLQIKLRPSHKQQKLINIFSMKPAEFFSLANDNHFDVRLVSSDGLCQ